MNDHQEVNARARKLLIDAESAYLAFALEDCATLVRMYRALRRGMPTPVECAGEPVFEETGRRGDEVAGMLELRIKAHYKMRDAARPLTTIARARSETAT